MKFIIRWFLYAVVIGVITYVLPGVSANGFVSLLALALILGIINAFIKPVLVLLTLPLTIVTLGLSTLIINALLIMLASWLVPGFAVSSFWSALIFSILLSLSSLFIRRENN